MWCAGSFGPGALGALRMQYKQYIDTIERDTVFKVKAQLSTYVGKQPHLSSRCWPAT
jgi:hypothetical protein